ncbi:hypothetical protein Tco_0488332 [Tanacetum coccineum]
MAYPLPSDTAYPVFCPIHRIHLTRLIRRIHFHWIRRIDRLEQMQCMTRSSTNELFTPYKDPEREFRSLRRHFKTLKEEAMAETMEQYMSKTRTDYGSGVARPKIDNKDQFELKGQFLKELRENTFSG